MNMAEVYRRFMSDELALDEAAEILRTHAPSWSMEFGSLDFQALTDDERWKAGQLLTAAAQPIVVRCLAGEVGVDRHLASLTFPLGVFSVNVEVPHGPGAEARMARW